MSDYLSPKQVAAHLRAMQEEAEYEEMCRLEYEAIRREAAAAWEQQRADMMDEALS